MSTLTTEPVASLLEHLFAESAASDATLQAMRSGATSDQTARLLGTPEYRQLYTSMKDFYLAVSPETARALYMLSRSIRARSIVEFGTSFGISTIYLAAALRDNGGGQVIGTEFERSKVERARANLSAAGLADLVDVREGDALETLARNLPDSIDLVLLDGAKPLYNPVLSLLEKRLRSGALIIADNTNYTPDYLARIHAADSGYISAPLGDDVELSMRL
jgi:predicted O-methyltransferase YrrM